MIQGSGLCPQANRSTDYVAVLSSSVSSQGVAAADATHRPDHHLLAA